MIARNASGVSGWELNGVEQLGAGDHGRRCLRVIGGDSAGCWSRFSGVVRLSNGGCLVLADEPGLEIFNKP